MSQHKLTDMELDTFSRYLWEHGDKRKLEAFRATFPKSKATNASASAKAGEIYEREKVKIQLGIKGLQASASEHQDEIGVGIEKRHRIYKFITDKLTTALEAAEQGNHDDRDIRSLLATFDHLNKLDGSYAAEKREDVTAYGPVVLTRGPVGSKAPSAG